MKRITLSAVAFALLALALPAADTKPAAAPIDRQALVMRHNVVVHTVDGGSALSVGNGQFAFTADVTGLQSLEKVYFDKSFPLETMSRWAWLADPNINNYTLADASEVVDTHGRPVAYPSKQSSPAGDWLRKNPRDFPLGQIGFIDEAGSGIALSEITDIDQRLDLWRGEIVSRFKFRGVPVEVSTICHPELDAIAVRIRSRALTDGTLRVRIAFPRGHDIKVKNTPPLDWAVPESHTTLLTERSATRVDFARARENLHYQVGLAWTAGAKLAAADRPHTYDLKGAGADDTLEFCTEFSPKALPDELPSWAATRDASAKSWEKFWRTGGAVDFSACTDSRADELERRVVLSQYVTAIQFGGDFPPSETGLTSSSWYGKHHTEMVWWHVAHFALWGRPKYTEGALDWFKRTLPTARELAKFRGLAGARWAKMVGPDGRESPGGNPFIVWNQPHPIYLAELLYRSNPTPETLAKWRDVVLESADCMASMLAWDEPHKRYVLGPPLWIAQEIYDQKTSQNPTYELSYWSFALQIAQHWRGRLGLPRNADWDKMRRFLSPLPVDDQSRYVALESTPDTWKNKDSRHDHPSFLMALGQCPGDGVNPEIMSHTLDAVLKDWDWETKIWGWDYPMIAMTAARLNQPDKAVDILLKDGPNNHYTPNGHCPQRGDLALYLPANGSLLSAVALMAAGWDDAPNRPAPGFPANGKWQVRVEGIAKLP